MATILYTREDIGNAKAWIKDHLRSNDIKDHIIILAQFSEAWRYVLSHTAGQCRRKILLALFDVDESHAAVGVDHTLTDCTNVLDTLVSCLHQLGPIGEVKASEWIRRSHASWTDGFDKASPSFGSGWSHSQIWRRNFMQACHALGYVERQLKSIIKHSGYAIQPVYIQTMCGR